MGAPLIPCPQPRSTGNATSHGQGLNPQNPTYVAAILSMPFCPYHFVQYHFARIPFCPLPFCPRTSGSISCSAMWIFHDILLYNLSVLKLEQIRLLLTGKFICYYDRGRAQKSV